jgi:hypothetical protein
MGVPLFQMVVASWIGLYFVDQRTRPTIISLEDREQVFCNNRTRPCRNSSRRRWQTRLAPRPLAQCDKEGRLDGHDVGLELGDAETLVDADGELEGLVDG